MAASATNPTSSIKYEAAYRQYGRIFTSLGLASRKKTHVPRGSAARLCESLGISSDGISKHSKLNEDVLSNAHLSQINQRVIRGMADLKGPVVKDYYSEHKFRWCPDEASRRFFKRCQAITDYIGQKVQEIRREQSQIVEFLERYRLSNAKSIDFLSKNLKKPSLSS